MTLFKLFDDKIPLIYSQTCPFYFKEVLLFWGNDIDRMKTVSTGWIFCNQNQSQNLLLILLNLIIFFQFGLFFTSCKNQEQKSVQFLFHLTFFKMNQKVVLITFFLNV